MCAAREYSGVKFPPQTAFEEPVCHSRRRINVVGLQRWRAALIHPGEKSVLGWVASSGGGQNPTPAQVPHTGKAAAGAWFATSFPPTPSPVLWIHTVAQSLCTTAPLLSCGDFCTEQPVVPILSRLSPTFPFYLLWEHVRDKRKQTAVSVDTVCIVTTFWFEMFWFRYSLHSIRSIKVSMFDSHRCERNLLQIMRASAVTLH